MALGADIDRWFFADRLPVPTFGSGGLLWAALTLALLTLPVVVVSVEEGLARIPPSLRDGSLALGATHGETIWRLLLPAARPALLTGLILAIARAAGAVAPLMLVGVVKLAPALPVDGDVSVPASVAAVHAPWLQRSTMRRSRARTRCAACRAPTPARCCSSSSSSR